MVFHTLDVRQGLEAAVLAGHQADRYARDGPRDGNAGVHEGQRTRAGAAHGGAAVGAEGLGDDAYRVGEVFLAGQDGEQGLFGQGAVADVAAARGADSLRLSGAEGREVVVEQEAFRLVGAQGVDLLGVSDGAERREAENLRLAALEEAAAVGPWQESHLAVEGPYFLQAASVGALAHVQHPVAELHRYGGLERLLDVVLVKAVSKLADQVVLQSGEPGRLLGLADAGLEGVS